MKSAWRVHQPGRGAARTGWCPEPQHRCRTFRWPSAAAISTCCAGSRERGGVADDGTAAVFQRFRFVDDSTLVRETFDDPRMSRAVSTTRFVFRDYRLSADQGAAHWAAIALDTFSVEFAPASGTIEHVFVATGIAACVHLRRGVATGPRPARPFDGVAHGTRQAVAATAPSISRRHRPSTSSASPSGAARRRRNPASPSRRRCGRIPRPGTATRKRSPRMRTPMPRGTTSPSRPIVSPTVTSGLRCHAPSNASVTPPARTVDPDRRAPRLGRMPHRRAVPPPA